jgi:hypothetical protein
MRDRRLPRLWVLWPLQLERWLSLDVHLPLVFLNDFVDSPLRPWRYDQ